MPPKKSQRLPPPGWRTIAAAQRNLLDRLNAERGDRAYIEHDLATHSCWGCGYCGQSFRPSRAHIKAVVFGGTYDPENYILLCDVCHREQPDAVSLEVLFEWLIRREAWLVRSMRKIHEISDAIQSISKKRGAEDMVEKYCDMLDLKNPVNHITEVLRHSQSAAQSSVTKAENMKWALVQDFVDWLDGQPESHHD